MSILSAIFGIKASQNKAITVLSPSEFRKHVEGKNIQLVDVRTPKEFNSGHISKSKNIDFFSGRFNLEFAKLNQELPLYIYCRSGSRSRQASLKLANMGFKDIYDLQGGILKY